MKKIIAFLVLMSILFFSCKKSSTPPPPVIAPSLITTAISGITSTAASSGGNINSDGGANITARGVCWSTGSSPTISDNKTIDGSGTGSFTSAITGLNPAVTYHVRAYATNSAGTGYGNDISFSTLVQTPAITTTSTSAITSTSVFTGGTISSDGGAPVSIRGVCWSTGSTPTISDNKTTNGSGTGSFTSVITGLNPSTMYYIRAYATNSAGTSYGNAVSFTSDAVVGGIVKDINGNIYHTITIGTQVWLLENLKTTYYRNGDSIPNVTDNTEFRNLTTGAFCNYDNNATNADTYGRLYNWYVVNDSRNVCPIGWHVPTYDELTTLATFLGGFNIAGGKLKEAGTAHWNSPNTGADNSSGFTALPGGFRDSQGIFFYIRDIGHWWSSSFMPNFNPPTPMFWYMNFNFEGVNRSAFSEKLGISIRCIKD